MTLVVRPWDGRVEGLGDGHGLPLPDGPLGGAVQRAAVAGGLAVGAGGDGEALVVEEGSYVGPKALASALAAGRAAGRDARVLPGGAAGELLDEVCLGLVRPGVVYLAPGGGDLGVRVAEAPELRLAGEERTLPLPLPDGREGLPLSDDIALPVRHWVHLLWADLLGLAPALWGALVGGGAIAAWRLAGAALRTLSIEPVRLAAAMSRLEEGAWVHPDATVEASWLGPGARVDAGAVVRGCVLGAGARVEEQANCVGVVLGPGAAVQRQALLRFAVMGEGAMVGGVTQLSVLGAHASLKRGSYGMDQEFDRDVRVRAGGSLTRAPLGLLGVCLGPGTQVGSGVHIAPGRALGPGLTIVRDGALLRPDPPADAGALLVVRGGRLEEP